MSNNGEDKIQMSTNVKLEQHRQMILDAEKKGKLATLLAFTKLSGPGWLQSAITLGGGSLSSALYLGVLVGFSFMWLQPLAMILGIIMMSAIAYVTLSTDRRPLRDINNHVSPILGWGWLLASMMANIVWSMPQFSLATASLQQNLFPTVFGMESAMGEDTGKIVVGLIILAITIAVVMLYNQGGGGVKAFEILVKMMVGSIVICFFGVVIVLTKEGSLNWGEICAGLIPDLSLLKEPVKGFAEHIANVKEGCQDFWNNLIVSQQRDVMISAAATAVGINMTFLLPYSMLRKGWNKDFRGLAIFDLSTGLFIPFILATGCVVIASASQFHAKPAMGFGVTEAEINKTLTEPVKPDKNLVGPYKKLMIERIKFEIEKDALDKLPDNPEQAKINAQKALAAFDNLTDEQKQAKINGMPIADRKMSAMLVKRDAFNLAKTLEPLTGKGVARYVFGFGVLFMALNAATMLMLINGLCFCELLNRPAKGWTQKFGSIMVSVGILGPFFWQDAKMWLAVPTSVFAMVLLPIAYFAFFALMNQKKVLGDNMPTGIKRITWNVLMATSSIMAFLASLWCLWSKLGWFGLVLMVLFLTTLVVVHKVRTGKAVA